MRFILGGVMHESHTFSAEITTLDKFEIARGDEILRFAGSNHSMGGAVDGCHARGIEVSPALFASATPAGLIPRDALESLIDELVEMITRLLPADGIVLTLHGAMVADGYPDAESAILQRVREVAGRQIPIAVTLDFHANIGQAMVDLATIVTTYDTYPHIDAGERADEAVGLLQRVVQGEITPVLELVKPPLMPVPQVQQTSIEPFRAIFDRAHELESTGNALTVSVAGGFAYADVPEAGVSFLVTTDGNREAARAQASELAEMLWERQEMLIAENLSVSDAVSEAIAATEWPVVLVDVGDNVGGGTPGDATEILAELIRQNAVDATIVIADPESVQKAIEAGVRQEVTLRVGGKIDRRHGDSVELTGTVVTISDGRWVHEGPENAGVPVDMGPTVVIRTGGINVVLTSVKSMPGDLNQLRSVGIEPAGQRVLVVKASVRWRGGYGPIMARGILVDTIGLGSVDLSRFDYRAVRRPIFPLDESFPWP